MRRLLRVRDSLYNLFAGIRTCLPLDPYSPKQDTNDHTVYTTIYRDIVICLTISSYPNAGPHSTVPIGAWNAYRTTARLSDAFLSAPTADRFSTSVRHTSTVHGSRPHHGLVLQMTPTPCYKVSSNEALHRHEYTNVITCISSNSISLDSSRSSKLP